MDAERWAKIEPLYHAALVKEPAERASYLEVACSDPELRSEVESLLAYADAQLTSSDEGSKTVNLWDHSRDLPTGLAVSHYRIVEKVGRGGMDI